MIGWRKLDLGAVPLTILVPMLVILVMLYKIGEMSF